MFHLTLKTPVGYCRITSDGESVVKLSYETETDTSEPSEQPLLMTAKQQLEQYFIDPNFQFSLPLQPNGTAFQRRIWNEINKIPRGTTTTYGAIAKQLRTSAQAVGTACRENPIPIIIPCHRVVGQGGIGGYAGQTEGPLIKLKKALLVFDRAAF